MYVALIKNSASKNGVRWFVSSVAEPRGVMTARPCLLATWRPWPADDCLGGVAFEPDADGAHVTGSHYIRPAHVDRHRKGDEKSCDATCHGSFTGRLRIVVLPWLVLTDSGLSP